MRLFLFFIDGVGLGPNDPKTNPLCVARMPALRSLLGGRPLTREAVPYSESALCVVPTDACLGVSGIPQSATGQTTIFSGQNAPLALGHHLSGFMSTTLKSILQAHSVFKQVTRLGKRATFLNAFRPQFLSWLQAGQPQQSDRRSNPSASTYAAMMAGAHVFRTMEQLQQGDALGFDIDHNMMRQRGYEIEPVDPVEAGRRAARIAGEHHFSLFEHFLTDFAGHAQDMAWAVETLERVDAFLSGVLATMPSDLTLLITSDHGNLEDLSINMHTENEVATIVKGPGAHLIGSRIRALTDITPAIISYLSGEGYRDATE